MESQAWMAILEHQYADPFLSMTYRIHFINTSTRRDLLDHKAMQGLLELMCVYKTYNYTSRLHVAYYRA